MSATEIARDFIPALIVAGFRAELFPSPLANGYGHKIALFTDKGIALGTLVIYRGKQGPRYVTNELTEATADIVDRIAKAWSTHAIETAVVTGAARSSVQLPPVPAGTIELWVDGACVPDANGLKFGWAYIIQRDDEELRRYASHVIEPYMAPHRNVAAELQAVIYGLEDCRRMGYTAVTVCYDYAGIAFWPAVTGLGKFGPG